MHMDATFTPPAPRLAQVMRQLEGLGTAKTIMPTPYNPAVVLRAELPTVDDRATLNRWSEKLRAIRLDIDGDTYAALVGMGAARLFGISIREQRA